jgi:hypothetical protein
VSQAHIVVRGQQSSGSDKTEQSTGINDDDDDCTTINQQSKNQTQQLNNDDNGNTATSQPQQQQQHQPTSQTHVRHINDDEGPTMTTNTAWCRPQ